ncbi:MAG: polymer-forming cytoskeletal protein [Deltaproteobacteria bacterium]|nr:polymer-forming cytoskeletal protein [Deltaproteobacteria bacterium]MBI3293747.1 polymer-forming cytoskeletal protein [Deltaproteobacteria bacterium]
MFQKKSDPFELPSVSHEITVVIQKGSHLEGRLQFEGTARIDGSFTGEIFTPDILIIGDEAEVSGQVEADVVVISGRFTGDILASQRVEVQAPAVVRGNIQSPVLQVEEGATFDGKTKMTGPLPQRSRKHIF